LKLASKTKRTQKSFINAAIGVLAFNEQQPHFKDHRLLGGNPATPT